VSEDTTPFAGAEQNWVTLVAMIVVGGLALVSLYMGFQAFGNNEIENAFLYLLIGISGFVAIGYSLFRSKPVKEDKLEAEEKEVITTLECNQCNLKKVRAFQRGDYLYKRDEPCTRCEGMMVVTRIHTREEKKKKR
jgi:hypothetical protein